MYFSIKRLIFILCTETKVNVHFLLCKQKGKAMNILTITRELWDDSCAGEDYESGSYSGPYYRGTKYEAYTQTKKGDRPDRRGEKPIVEFTDPSLFDSWLAQQKLENPNLEVERVSIRPRF
jgi:hypothetical protein